MDSTNTVGVGCSTRSQAIDYRLNPPKLLCDIVKVPLPELHVNWRPHHARRNERVRLTESILVQEPGNE